MALSNVFSRISTIRSKSTIPVGEERLVTGTSKATEIAQMSTRQDGPTAFFQELPWHPEQFQHNVQICATAFQKGQNARCPSSDGEYVRYCQDCYRRQRLPARGVAADGVGENMFTEECSAQEERHSIKTMYRFPARAASRKAPTKGWTGRNVSQTGIGDKGNLSSRKK